MNTMHLDKLVGAEIAPGIICIGEPTPIPGTNKMTALANVYGTLCLVELSVNFHKAEIG